MYFVGGVDYIDKIFKHLPRDFIDETNTLKRSFQKLLEYLEDGNDEESKIYDQLEPLYEQVSSLCENNVKSEQE